MNARTLLLVALLGLGVLPAWIPTTVAATDWLETFTDDTPPATPTSDHYTYARTGTGSFAVLSGQTMGNAFKTQDTLGSATSRIEESFKYTTITGFALQNSGQSFTFSLRFDTLPGGTNSVLFVMSQSDGALTQANAFYVGIEVTPAGLINQYQMIGGTVATQSTGISFTAGGTWKNITLLTPAVYDTTGCEVTSRVFLPDSNTGPLDLNTNSAATNCDTASLNRLYIYERTPAAGETIGTFWLDNLAWDNGPDPPPPTVGAAATWAVGTAIEGFDVNDAGDVAIVRHTNGGEVVETRTTGSFTDANQEDDTDCNSGGRDDTDKVMVQDTPGGTLIMYMDCDGSGLPTHMRVRLPSFTSPTGQAINNCTISECANIPLNEFTESDSDDQGLIGQLVQFPINFNHRQENAGVNDAWTAAWGFTGIASREGQFGVYTYRAREGLNDDLARIFNVATGFPDPAVDLCTGVNSAGGYIGAAESSSAARIYPVTWSNNTNGDGLIATFGTPSTPISGAVAIDCENDLAAIATSTTFGVYTISTGTAVWTESCTCQTRGTAISRARQGNESERYVAWADSSTVWKVAYASNGTARAQGTLADGTDIVGMELDDAANNLFVASGSNVRRYYIASVIGVAGTGGTIADPPSTGDGQLVQDAKAGIAAGLGITEFQAGLLLVGIILMAVGLLIIKHSAATGGVMCGVSAVMWGWGFDWIPREAIITIVVVAIIGLIMTVFLSKGGD